MKKSILGLVAIGALVAGPAMAVDLRMPVKAPPAPLPPVFSWTGLYLGVDGGVAWGSESWIDNSSRGIPPGVAISHTPNGGVFGGLIGYRYQINNNIVIVSKERLRGPVWRTPSTPGSRPKPRTSKCGRSTLPPVRLGMPLIRRCSM